MWQYTLKTGVSCIFIVYIVWEQQICRVGQNHTFKGIYGVYTVFLAGKSPYVRCVYTVLANLMCGP
jgi:hypothetical protein